MMNAKNHIAANLVREYCAKKFGRIVTQLESLGGTDNILQKQYRQLEEMAPVLFGARQNSRRTTSRHVIVDGVALERKSYRNAEQLQCAGLAPRVRERLPRAMRQSDLSSHELRSLREFVTSGDSDEANRVILRVCK